jgi:bla regulator protein blaR1
MFPPYVSPVLNHLWQSTLVAVVAGALALALRRNHAKTRYAIWLVASLKFLFPFSVLMTIGSRFEWHTVALAPHSAPAQVIEEVFVPAAVSTAAPVSVAAASNLIPILLLVAWAMGFAGVVFSWWLRWRRVRASVRAAKPLSVEGSEPVLVSGGLMEPGAFGIFRPVLLLPEGISEHLAPAHLEAILAHELCHIRRRDNLAAALHMLVEAVFWFHPLVWWIGARLVEERERACDEEVLRLGSQPQVYAESILKTCQYYLESPLACLSGVTGADLKKRIVHIMTPGAAIHLALGKKLLLAVIGMAAIAGPIAYGLAKAPQNQSQPTTPLSFEVASIRPNKSGEQAMGMFPTPGLLRVRNYTPRFLIEAAYGMKRYQVSGGPSWIDSQRYDIVAKAADKATFDQMLRMLRTLLAERFQLKFHRETKTMPVYSLVAAKGGPKLLPQKDGDSKSFRFHVTPSELTGHKVPMNVFVDCLSGQLDRPLVDRTGLKGNYDFSLRYTPDSNSPDDPNDSSGASIYRAIQDQLGLKLVVQKGPAEVLVIDNVEKPSEN